MSDIQSDRIMGLKAFSLSKIGTIKNLPATASYNDILEAIIIQKQIEESSLQIQHGKFHLHDEVMQEQNHRVKGLGLY